MKPPFPLQTVDIDDLNLDLRNSRFPRNAQSQDDAVQLMMTTAGEDCLQLLRDVTKSGEMNSADLPIVVQKSGHFVVMEGNRRLTCLRIWHDPAALAVDDDLERAYLSRSERLVAESAYAPPKDLRVAIAPSEEAADHWIERKHSGGAGGAGTVEWGAAMKDRRKARNDPTAASRAMAFIELISTELDEDHDIQADLETVRTKRYTFIQRFVDRVVVRNRLGLQFKAGKMTFIHGTDATREIVRAVLHDFAQPKAESGKTWARELDTVEDFAAYLDGYSKLLPTTSSDGNPPPNLTSDDTSQAEGGEPPHSTPPDASHPVRDSRTTSSKQAAGEGGADDSRPPRPNTPPAYIFRGLVLDAFTNRIQEIVRQTSLLNVPRQTEVASVLLRVILDLATYQFLKSHGKDVEKHLDKNLRSAIKLIQPNASDSLGQAENTSQLSKAFHETTPDSIRLVQYAVHDVHSGRTASEVFTLAARYEQVLVSMNQHMGNIPIS